MGLLILVVVVSIDDEDSEDAEDTLDDRCSCITFTSLALTSSGLMRTLASLRCICQTGTSSIKALISSSAKAQIAEALLDLRDALQRRGRPKFIRLAAHVYPTGPFRARTSDSSREDLSDSREGRQLRSRASSSFAFYHSTFRATRRDRGGSRAEAIRRGAAFEAPCTAGILLRNIAISVVFVRKDDVTKHGTVEDDAASLMPAAAVDRSASTYVKYLCRSTHIGAEVPPSWDLRKIFE